ncbi:uncharacterized protein LOC110698814 [Chenopodium quinoa]|uniref:uncharacterized protein LOC110698814 n=1 Tax=Chenopodium quinoa TaxID=63459 RepID=UPI000B788A22|nr:uncharacterized protein LOC110698814 [Chenopodium quinoa]
MVKEIEGLSEDERKALRHIKFAPLPSKLSSLQSSSLPRLAHPGGPVTTNKAVALAKFLERKLQEPGGLDTLKPELVELAVKNAKETVNASGTSNHGKIIRHVTSFDDDEDHSSKDGSTFEPKKKKLKKEKKDKKKKYKKKKVEDQ